ncbi:MAG: DUF1080 domain-containing protein [Cyanobacteria bacterium]|nr:DUF1080 domain-containing protein [Cyanobacteriota bacterium]
MIKERKTSNRILTRARFASLAVSLLVSLSVTSCAQKTYDPPPSGPPPEPPKSSADEKDFVALGNGKDMTDFDLAGTTADTWPVEDGIIKCTGNPKGYFATKKSYKNYTLRLDIRYPEKPGNSGFLVHIIPPHKVWPACIEVQGMYDQLCAVFPIGGMAGPKMDDYKARNLAIKPYHQWNSIEVISKDGMVTSKINGQKVAEAGPFPVKEGPIGFQSEGVPIYFHNLRIKEETDSSPTSTSSNSKDGEVKTPADETEKTGE